MPQVLNIKQKGQALAKARAFFIGYGRYSFECVFFVVFSPFGINRPEALQSTRAKLRIDQI